MAKHIVSFSGGKDSTAMLLMMLERGMQVDRVVFADTQLEFPEMYKWLDVVENYTGIKIERTKPHNNKTWDDWFYGILTRGKLKGRRRGFPYIAYPCFWSREAKFKPLQTLNVRDNIVYLGITSDEIHRSNGIGYKKSRAAYRFPLIEFGMSESDCADYVNARFDYPLSKFRRTGCWLCPKQSLHSLEILYTDYPDLWEKLKQYEYDSPHGFRDDYTLDQLELRFSQLRMVLNT